MNLALNLPKKNGLVFFGETRVSHVALCTSPGRIIHSSLIVRESSLIAGEPDYYGRNILHVRRILGHLTEGELKAIPIKDSPRPRRSPRQIINFAKSLKLITLRR